MDNTHVNLELTAADFENLSGIKFLVETDSKKTKAMFDEYQANKEQINANAIKYFKAK